MRRSLALWAVAAWAAAGQGALAAGDAATGRAVAELWCAACHLVGPEQTSAVSGPPAPPFEEIAERSEAEIDALAGFLADPHPPMPQMSLTRQEILDLLAYIGSLR
jgi:mono/diheme cytochrome c family protein